MGHDLNAGLIAATALAASRAARRDARGLYEQAHAIDTLIDAQFGLGVFATGVLATLDLRRGTLRYLSAGHLNPLVLRYDRVVKRLAGGRRVPFGLGNGEATIAEEALQPGDWLVLHTDGITEARGRDDSFFGDQRLADFLEREAAAHRPPPETVRRLIHAVLDYQHGQLSDDATVLLAQWTPPTPTPN
jgi:serine phosphatase RsbU (regulator of sigma subunit)